MNIHYGLFNQNGMRLIYLQIAIVSTHRVVDNQHLFGSAGSLFLIAAVSFCMTLP